MDGHPPVGKVAVSSNADMLPTSGQLSIFFMELFPEHDAPLGMSVHLFDPLQYPILVQEAFQKTFEENVISSNPPPKAAVLHAARPVAAFELLKLPTLRESTG